MTLEKLQVTDHCGKDVSLNVLVWCITGLWSRISNSIYDMNGNLFTLTTVVKL